MYSLKYGIQNDTPSQVSIELSTIATCADGELAKGMSVRWKSSVKLEQTISTYRYVLTLVSHTGAKFSFLLSGKRQLDIWMAGVKKNMTCDCSPLMARLEKEIEHGPSTLFRRPSKKHLISEAIVQDTTFETNSDTELRNLVKRLRERADTETGKTSCT